MSVNSLTGSTPAATRAQLLHIGTGTATNAVVRLGDGTATCLSFTATGMAVAGMLAATNLTITTAATIAGVVLKPRLWKHLTATVSCTGTTPVAMPDFTLGAPVSGATYELDMVIFGTASLVASALQIVNTGGAGTLYLFNPVSGLGITAAGGTYAPTTSPSIGPFVIHLKGLFIASSTDDLTFSLKCDDAGTVNAQVGSAVNYTRVA